MKMMKKIISRIAGLPVGVKASIGFFAANIISNGISYIVTPLYTRLLTPEEYGGYSLYATWLQIFGIIAMFCLQHGVFNNGMIDYPEKRNEYSFSMLFLSNVITCIFFVCITVFYPYIKTIIGIEFNFLIVMFVVFLTQPAYNFWFMRQRYELKYKNVIISTFLLAVISQSVTLISVLLTKGRRLDARIYGSQLSFISIYLLFSIYLAKKSKFKVDTSFWKPALKFNIPLIPHYLSMYLLGNSDKVMIANIVGEASTAYYSVAHSIASLALIVWSSINGSLIPFTYDKCKNKDYASISRITIPILFVFGAVCLMVIMFAPEVVRIMATDAYMEAIYVIPPIIGGVFFSGPLLYLR